MSCLHPNPPDCFTQPDCPNEFGCPSNRCPDFQIKRGDTQPPLRVSISDENGPVDFTGLVIEANMWANAKLKTNITALTTSISFADNIGFQQVLTNDIILLNRARNPEQMRVVGFDEDNSLVIVERGVNNTIPSDWKKGTCLNIFRIMNAPALSELVYDDITQVDGTIDCNQLMESNLVYEWDQYGTCTQGCYWFEFKVLKMSSDIVIPSVIPTCFLGVGVEWTRRYPSCNSLLIKICDSNTVEIVTPLSTT